MFENQFNSTDIYNSKRKEFSLRVCNAIKVLNLLKKKHEGARNCMKLRLSSITSEKGLPYVTCKCVGRRRTGGRARRSTSPLTVSFIRGPSTVVCRDLNIIYKKKMAKYGFTALNLAVLLALFEIGKFLLLFVFFFLQKKNINNIL